MRSSFLNDPHSFYRDGQPRMTHLDWDVTVHFEAQRIWSVARITFDRGGDVDLDTRGLTIESVDDASGHNIAFALHESQPVLGARLSFRVPDGDSSVSITYTTSPDASGLQWLTPQQTRSGRYPYLFSQGECIHARSYVPCQDTPAVRFTYDARLSVPKALQGVMGAAHEGRVEEPNHAVEHWRMPQRIPAYLIAFAVGELASRDITARCRVWTDPDRVDAAAEEFEEVGAMMDAAERLFGPYDWDRFDLLLLPPSFPYGGMENPRLTFLTPTLVTGDRSMVHVVGHELAHSWTGNLITNAAWRHFWLNEGWTTYVEWRISEELHGRDAHMLNVALLAREHARDVAEFSRREMPECAALASFLPATVDPDDVFSRVPYFKGALFLRALEEAVGRERFDAFIRTYIARFRFTSITTETFLDFVAAELPGALERVQAWRWVYEPGIPEGAPTIASPLIAEVERHATNATSPSFEDGERWSAPQWVLYLELLPRPVTPAIIAELDKRFSLRTHPNIEVLWTFLLLAEESGVTSYTEEVEQFLASVGRMKYLRPLYRALTKTHERCTWARACFERFRPGYHPIAQAVVGKELNEAEQRRGC